MKTRLGYLAALLLLMLAVTLPAQTRYYVDGDQDNDDETGLEEWGQAKKYLQSAIALASDGDEIWVAEETYYPDDGCNEDDQRACSFEIPDGVKLYGGFAGDEESLEDRDWKGNETTLSGDIDGTPDDSSGNAYHVVKMEDVGDGTVVDGFTIKAGNANSSSQKRNVGAGIHNINGSPQIANCIISGNRSSSGGGIYIQALSDGTASPTFTNCTIIGNSSGSGSNGGGIYIHANGGIASPTLTNCIISGNRSWNGGGMYIRAEKNSTASPTLTNCTINANSVRSQGSGVYVMNQYSEEGGIASPHFINCIVWGQLWSNGSNKIVQNYKGSPHYSYSIIEGSRNRGKWWAQIGQDDGNNIDSDPLFVMLPPDTHEPTTEGNYRLFQSSPAIDAGDPETVLEGVFPVNEDGVFTDIEGDERIQDGRIDIGAYEGSELPPKFYVKNNDANPDGDGSDWENAFQNLEDAIAASAVSEIWVAAGTYTSAFKIKTGMRIYGGFSGVESTLDERDWVQNETILRNPDGTVVTFNNVSNETILDGFTIKDGNAENEGGGILNKDGSPQIANCIIRDNTARTGGGIYNKARIATANPTFINCIISGNSAPGPVSGSQGGGIYNYADGTLYASGDVSIDIDANPIFTNCIISGNSSHQSGGGFHNRAHNKSNASPILTNCIISGNRCETGNGGGFYNYSGSEGSLTNPIFTNCSIISNSSHQLGGGFYNQASSGGISNLTLTNSIVWGNKMTRDDPMKIDNVYISYGAPPIAQETTIYYSYSIIEGSGGSGGQWQGKFGQDDGNNFDSDPMFEEAIPNITIDSNNPTTEHGVRRFLSTTEGNFRLFQGSPAIDAGDPATVLEDVFPVNEEGAFTDIEGDERIEDGRIDMGAYEGGKLPPHFYVKKNGANPDGDGSDWDNAFQSLEDAIAVSPVSEIWVAEGTYTSAFNINNGMRIYGGFSGVESTLDERDWVQNETILRNPDGAVVTFNPGSNESILDGFTITDGSGKQFPSGSTFITKGGGIYNMNGSPQIANCIIRGNSAQFGGGIYNFGSDGTASPMVTNCTISDNVSEKGNGGGILNETMRGTASPTLTNCIISGNMAKSGGGINNKANLGSSIASPTLINCIISGNYSTGGGNYSAGAFFNYARRGIANPRFINSTITGNYCSSGSGGFGNFLYHESDDYETIANPIFINSIMWGNKKGSHQIENVRNASNNAVSLGSPHYSYSNIEGSGGSGEWEDSFGDDGENNIDQKPWFILPVDIPLDVGHANPFEPTTEGNFRLFQFSGAVDMGDPATVFEGVFPVNDLGVFTDIEGDERIQGDGNRIDMGAYEGGEAPAHYYVKSTAPNPDGDGSDWENAFQNLENAIAASSISEIWVAAGTYTSAFNIKSGMEIYGGFSGVESTRDERDRVQNETILRNPDGAVVTFNNVSNETILDGFTITDGSGKKPTSGAVNQTKGGGIYNENGSPQIVNCTITNNTCYEGGGIFNFANGQGKTANPTFTNCTISGNRSTRNGGGFSNKSINGTASPIFTNCIISGNKAGGGSGGIYNYVHTSSAGSPIFTNCTISGNSTASGAVGAMFTYLQDTGTSIPIFTNCIVWGNTAPTQRQSHAGTVCVTTAGRSSGNTANFINSVIEGSGSSGDEWDICGGTDGGNNLDQDPRFIDSIEWEGKYISSYWRLDAPSSGGDFHLDNDSPAIDTGTSDGLDLPDFDLAGDPRVHNDIIDMGAYEFSGVKEDFDPPTVESLCPSSEGRCPNWAADEFNVDTPLLISFDEKVVEGEGTIEVSAEGQDPITIEVPSDPLDPNRAIIDRNEATIIFEDPLAVNVVYSVMVDGGAFKDKRDNLFTGIDNTEGNRWHFLIDRNPPTVTFSPAAGSSGNAVDTDITLSFGEEVFLSGDGAELDDENVDDIITLKDANELDINIDFDATVSHGEETVITVNPTDNFSSEQRVYVAIGATVEDEAGNSIEASEAIFTIADVLAPTVTFDPASGATSVAPNAVITISFGEEVFLSGDGAELDDENVDALITLKEDDEDGSDIDFDAAVASEGETVITVTPSSNFTSEQVIYVAMDAVKDGAGNAVSGTLDATFSTALLEAPTVEVTADPSVIFPTSISPIPIIVTFNKEVSGFELSDISITNGSGGNFSTVVSGRKFTADITPSNREVTVNIIGGVAKGQYDTPNAASNSLSIIYDATAPTVEYTGTSPTTGKYDALDGAINVALDLSNITLTFNKRVKKKAAEGGVEELTADNLSDVITFKKATSAEDADFDGGGGSTVDYSATVAAVQLAPESFGHQITLDPDADVLDSKSDYYVAVNAEKIVDFNDASLVHAASSATFSTVDNEGPKIISFEYDEGPGTLSLEHGPSTLLSDVPTESDLIIVFDEDVQVEEGSLILFRKIGGDSDLLVDEISLPGSPPSVTGNNTSRISINLEEPLESFVEYYIQIDARSFKDDSDNEFEGIDDATTWNFVTKDEQPPEYVSHTPDPDDELFDLEDEDAIIEITFTEAVVEGAGSVVIYDDDFTVVETIDISDVVIPEGSRTVQISPENLASGGVYHILINEEKKDEGVLTDGAGNPLADIVDDELIQVHTTDIQPPIIDQYSVTLLGEEEYMDYVNAYWYDDEPYYEINSVDWDDGVDLDSQIQIHFDEALFRTGGDLLTNDNILEVVELYIEDQEGDLDPVDIYASISADKDVITLEPEEELWSEETYYVWVIGGALEDAYGNVLNEDRIASFFTADIYPPWLDSTVPESGETGVDIETEVQLIFDEPIGTDEGILSIIETSTGETFAEIDFYDWDIVTVDEEVITIELGESLESSTAYHILIDEDAVYDLGFNYYEGIDDPEEFVFTTGDFVPPEVTFTPEHVSEHIAVDTDLVIGFSEPITIEADGGITDENVASLVSFSLLNEETDEWEDVAFNAIINAAADTIILTLPDDEDGNPTLLLGNRFYMMEIDDTIMDEAGNSIDPSPQNSEFLTAPTDAPTVEVSTELSSPTNASPIAVAMEFSEAVTEFDSVGVSLSGGAVASFSGEEASYTVSITPSEGEVSVWVEGEKGFNEFDIGNAASNVLRLIYDSTPPTVTFAPADGTEDVALDAKVYITFSEPVFTDSGYSLALSDLTGSVSVRKDSIDGEVQSFDMAYNDTTGVIKLTPPDSLISAALYYVSITTELYDKAGNPFAGDSSYFKSEDIDPPTITLVPADGATDVAVNAYIRVIFSERVYSETGERFGDFDVSDGMVVVREDNASGEEVTFFSQISLDTTAITIQTDDLLKSEQTYYVQVNPRFADVNGTVVEGVYGTFTTADVIPPEITLYPEAGEVDVPLETELTISFSEPVRLTDNSVMTAENVKDLLYVNIWNPEGEAIEFTVSVNAARDEIILFPSEAYPPYEKIVFGLKEGLEDYSDNLAGSAAGYFFTTGIPGFDIDPLSGITTTETGLSDTFEVALTSEPDAPVELNLMSTDVTEGMPYPTQLSFDRHNWDQKQWVKVTGVDDPDADDDITYHIKLFNITSEDPDYNDFEVDSVEAININDDPPGVQVYPISRLITSEEAKQAQFGVVLLSRPVATVTIPVSVTDATEASIDVTQLVFEPEDWDQEQLVTLTGLDDAEDDDDIEYSVVLGQCVSEDVDYSLIDPTDVLAINIDDDVAGFMVSYNKVVRTHEMGLDSLFSVTLNTEPTGTVAISVSSEDVTEGTVSHDYVTFTPADWNIPQEVTVTGVNDNLGDGDIYYNIIVGESIITASPSYGRLDAKEVNAVNLDMEPEIKVVSELMSFDSSDVGVLDSAFVMVTNSGVDRLVLNRATVNDSAFSTIFTSGPIKSGDSSLVTVYFLPDKQGKKESVLYMEHNDPYQFPKELLISASVLDRSGPAIIELVNNPSTISTGSGVEVTTQVSDASGISVLELNYTSGVSGFSSLDMAQDSETSFSGTIPSGTADLTGLAYFIVATDVKGNITSSDTISVPVTFGDTQLSTDIAGSAYPSGISKDAWRLISVPNLIDENKATQIFGDELKKRNERTWRLVYDRDSEEKWRDVNEVTPGMGMWLYQQVKDKVSFSTGSGTTSDLKRYELTVRPGWSIMGSPYAFPFEADIDGEVFSGPYGYALDGVEGWSDVVTQFQPWAGYIIKNLTSQDQVLTLRPLASAGTDSTLKREIAGKQIGWTVNLAALSGRVGDLYNKMGRQPGASESIGPFDHAEPPIMPGGISLAFRQGNGRLKKHMYARDMRSVSEHNGTWPVDLRVKDVKQPISLTAEMDEHYPLDHGLVILDHQTREVTDLREDPDLKIHHSNEDIPYRFTVVSGDGDYIIRKVEEILAGIPERFSLGQNYPNPFNSTTTIRYALPLPEFVHITIYNILGQEVHRMVGSWQEAGFHTARWDGRDLHGIPVSSGVYIYHIQAGKFMAARKMAIIK